MLYKNLTLANTYSTSRICQEPFIVFMYVLRLRCPYLERWTYLYINLTNCRYLWRRTYCWSSRCPSDPHYLPTHCDQLMCCIETRFCIVHHRIITLNPKEKSTCKRSHLTTSFLQNEKRESTTIGGWMLNGRAGSASWGDIINPLPGHG